jgi:hypothetical protein
LAILCLLAGLFLVVRHRRGFFRHEALHGLRACLVAGQKSNVAE